MKIIARLAQSFALKFGPPFAPKFGSLFALKITHRFIRSATALFLLTFGAISTAALPAHAQTNYSQSVGYFEGAKTRSVKTLEALKTIGGFVVGPAWFKRDTSITVRNILTTGSITPGYDREELKGNLKKLREAAAPHGKKLAVLFEARGCYYCQKLDDQVLNRKDIKRLVDREFELVRVDVNGYSSIVDLDGGQMTETTLSKQWKVTNTPTMIFFPANKNALPGKEIILSRMSGVHEPEKIKELLYKVSAHGKDPDALAKLQGFRRLENGGSCSSASGGINPMACMFNTMRSIVSTAVDGLKGNVTSQ